MRLVWELLHPWRVRLPPDFARSSTATPIAARPIRISRPTQSTSSVSDTSRPWAIAVPSSAAAMLTGIVRRTPTC
ncbi:hypothetical protein [Streptomyces sp. A5-4]|uniref:hypothetical protein n=1 Tax=Streptomyces sp. A5-4 TaxID=3384771 RepID=UPI003DA85FB2